MLMLYAGKASGVLVTLLFIPFYNRILGPEQFGVAAVLLSLQALLIMLDLGLATLVGRDVASGDVPQSKLWAQVCDAERALLGLYLVIFCAAIVAHAFNVVGNISTTTLVCSTVLFGFLVIQNLHYCVIVATGKYARASITQLVGNLLRAAATAIVLSYYSATLETFVVVQAIVAGLQAWGTRIQSAALLKYDANARHEPGVRGSWDGTLRLIRRSGSLALFAAAGAAVMQLDKPIISAFMSSANVGPYFLAMTLCLVPTSVLAGPVTQYFQSKVLAALGQGNAAHIRHTVDRFTLTMLAATLLPCLVIWLMRADLVAVWLGHRTENELVVRYVEVLLPGVMIGALGYIPYTLLLAAQDYSFQGKMSLLLTVLTLLAAAWAAHQQSIAGVAVVYALYHVCSTVLSWARTIYLSSTRELAIRSGRPALAAILVIMLAIVILTQSATLSPVI